MYSALQLGIRYIHYYLTAHNGKGHGVHSPFVFSFITQVLNDDRHFYAYQNIENLRQLLLQDQRRVNIGNMDTAGVKEKQRRVGDVAFSSLPNKKISQLLFRIADHYAPGNILVLGTSLGITPAYLASAGKDIKVTTLEGVSEIAAVAASNFSKLGLSNIQLIQGNFDDTLLPALEKLQLLDMVFIHGDHSYELTMRYFRQILPHLHENSILIVDDIHASKEQEQAWSQIKEQEAVTLSIDLFFIGLVFFRKEQKVKQHFTIRF